jgi:erythromycin esterase
MSIRRALIALLASAAAAGCRSNRPAVALPPPPLSDSAAAALRWVDAHAIPLAMFEETRPASDRTPIVTFVGNARVVGVSELTEGTHEFAGIMQEILAALSARGFRGIAIQAPMAEAMELDRYVRAGTGDPRQWLRALGPHWNTQEVLNLVEWIRNYDRSRTAASDQIGFYGFELPNAGHALQIISALPDSVAGASTNAYIKRELQCVSTGESAAWGREGPAADSTFWNRCRGATEDVVDTLAVLRQRIASRPAAAASVAFAEQMARLAHHDADVGLKHLPRHQTVAEHILWLANGLGTDGNLLVWGRDVESGRLTGEGGVVQSAVPLASNLGDRYRNLAFMVGDGVVRAQPFNIGQREPGGETNMTLRPARSGTYEDMLNRTSSGNLFVDLRGLGADSAAAWLKGPHPARLVSGVYSVNAAGAFETSIQFPTYYDGLLFVKHATHATPLKR